MKINKFKKTQLAASISFLMGSAALALPAIAQEQAKADEDVEVISVRGIKASLISSSALKARF